MTKSPCIGCELEDADKNNPTCRECDRRVEYVALIEGDEGGIMGATNIGTEGQASPLATPGRQRAEESKKECVIEGCKKKAHARGLCHSHYKLWREGRIEHPTLGKFVKARGYNKKKPKIKKTVAAVPGVKADLPGASKVDLNNYPKIKHQIDFLADKYLVNPEHVIIGLLGEALAARRDNE